MTEVISEINNPVNIVVVHMGDEPGTSLVLFLFQDLCKN
jgi:hypothetical protein